MKKAIIILTSVLSIALLSGGVYFYIKTNKLSVFKEKQRISVRLAWVHQAQFAGMYVAKEKGFYEEEGLEVTLKEFEEEVDQIRELIDGEVDFTITGAAELLAGIDRDYDAVAVAVIYQSSPFVYASLAELNIKEPKDLVGKVLGNAGGGIEIAVGYDTILGLHGIDKNSVKFVNLGFDSTGDVVDHRADTVPLYRTDQTYQLDKRGIKYNLLLPEKFGFDVYGDTLITSRLLIDKNPELVAKFVRATLKGWEYALRNFNEAIVIIQKYDNKLYKDIDYERHILEESASLIKPIGGTSIGSMEFLRWNRIYRAMVDSGAIRGAFNIKDAYTSRFLK